MGNKQSQPQALITKANFNPDTEIVSKTFDAHYGDIKIVRDFKTHETMILKELVLNTKQAFEAEQAYFNTRISVKHNNIVNVIGYNTQDKHNFCSTYYKVALYIEHFEENLQTLLESRRAAREPLTEGELLLIADDMITALSYFQSQGFSHGDIRPFNIFHKEQIHKLNDPSLNAQKNSNGLTQAIVHGTKTYLAPELIPQVPQQKFEITTDKYKADVYSLGVTLLSLATLTNSEDLYDFEKGTVNETLIRERLNNVSQNYSKFTHDLIEDMLIPEEAGRPDSIQVSNKVTPHKEYMRREYHGRPIVDSRTHIEERGERVKRANLPSDDSEYRTGTIEELEARIKAAIQRTEETFKIVRITPGLSGVFGTAKQPEVSATHTATQGGYTSNVGAQGTYTATPGAYTHTHTAYVPASTYTTEAVRDISSQPLVRSQVGQDNYATYNYTNEQTVEKPVKRNEERVVRGAIPTFDEDDSASANANLRASGGQVQVETTNPHVSTFSYEAKNSGVEANKSSGFGATRTSGVEANKTSGVVDATRTSGFQANKTSGVVDATRTSGVEANKTSGFGATRTSGVEANKTSGVGAGNVETSVKNDYNYSTSYNYTAQPSATYEANTYSYSAQPTTTYEPNAQTYSAQPTTTYEPNAQTYTAQGTATYEPNAQTYSAQPTTTYEPNAQTYTAQGTATYEPNAQTYTAQPTTTYEPNTYSYSAQPTSTYEPYVAKTYSAQPTTTYEAGSTGNTYYGVATHEVGQNETAAQNGSTDAIEGLVNKFVEAVTGEGSRTGVEARGSFSDHVEHLTASQQLQAQQQHESQQLESQI